MSLVTSKIDRAKVSMGWYAAMVRSVPFAQPRLSQVVFATSSGIFLSVGIELILRLLDQDAAGWKPLHTAGLLFVIASIALSLLAWLSQEFLDFLITAGKDHAQSEEKTVQYESWPTRRIGWLLLLIVFAATSGAFMILMAPLSRR